MAQTHVHSPSKTDQWPCGQSRITRSPANHPKLGLTLFECMRMWYFNQTRCFRQKLNLWAHSSHCPSAVLVNGSFVPTDCCERSNTTMQGSCLESHGPTCTDQRILRL
eukprot:1973185-Amphidinium_carterae.1